MLLLITTAPKLVVSVRHVKIVAMECMSMRRRWTSTDGFRSMEAIVSSLKLVQRSFSFSEEPFICRRHSTQGSSSRNLQLLSWIVLDFLLNIFGLSIRRIASSVHNRPCLRSWTGSTGSSAARYFWTQLHLPWLRTVDDQCFRAIQCRMVPISADDGTQPTPQVGVESPKASTSFVSWLF